MHASLSAVLPRMLVLAALQTPAVAAPPVLILPLACEPNRDCWIANHVDLDPGPGVKDYACGALSYDKHKGTDFAIRDRAAMADGVAVWAAAAGRVRSRRDGVPDVSVRAVGKDSVEGRECGNGVLLEHDDGWETQYCHLRKDSVRVQAGEQVEAGQVLGLIGMSGLTEYPHVHLSVRRHGRLVDPFRGEPSGVDCVADKPLWRADVAAWLPYAPGAVYNSGIAAERPEADEVRSGRYRKADALSVDAPVIVFFAEVFGVNTGDILELHLSGPDGATLARHSVHIAQRQARRYAYIGVRRKEAAWTPGIYRGEALLRRADGGRTPANSQSSSMEIR